VALRPIRQRDAALSRIVRSVLTIGTGGVFPVQAFLRLRIQGTWSAVFAEILIVSFIGIIVTVFLAAWWRRPPQLLQTQDGILGALTACLIPGVLIALVPITAVIDESVAQLCAILTAGCWFLMYVGFRTRVGV